MGAWMTGAAAGAGGGGAGGGMDWGKMMGGMGGMMGGGGGDGESGESMVQKLDRERKEKVAIAAAQELARRQSIMQMMMGDG